MAIPYSRTIAGDLPWYSVLVVMGIALAIWLAAREEKRLQLPADTVIDLALVAVPCGIAGARIYYVAMRWEVFAAEPVSALYIWQGGLAIYGAVIGGALGTLIYAHRKQLSFAVLADAVAPGLLLAQAVGRWGNYFNMEAYGPVITDDSLHFFPLAVYIPLDGQWHAATFFYESVWNMLGFAALWWLRKKQHRRGNVFAWYLLIYGAGRFIIEQLREDSLYIGGLRASQYLSLILCIASSMLLIGRALGESKKTMAAGTLCALAWIARWMFLNQHGWYAAALLVSGIVALWIKRRRRRALAWLGAALALDGLGLMAAVMGIGLPVVNTGIHAAACSLTLPMGIWALCIREE